MRVCIQDLWGNFKNSLLFIGGMNEILITKPTFPNYPTFLSFYTFQGKGDLAVFQSK